MFKIAFAILLMALLACGSENINQGASITPTDLPPVSANGSNIDEVATLESAIENVTDGEFEIDSCLALVTGGEFANALPVCAEAEKIAPENAAVRAAIEEARAQMDANAKTAAADVSALYLEFDSTPGEIRTPRVKPPRP